MPLKAGMSHLIAALRLALKTAENPWAIDVLGKSWKIIVIQDVIRTLRDSFFLTIPFNSIRCASAQNVNMQQKQIDMRTSGRH